VLSYSGSAKDLALINVLLFGRSAGSIGRCLWHLMSSSNMMNPNPLQLYIVYKYIVFYMPGLVTVRVCGQLFRPPQTVQVSAGLSSAP